MVGLGSEPGTGQPGQNIGNYMDCPTVRDTVYKHPKAGVESNLNWTTN